jgi:hypothetical protein
LIKFVEWMLQMQFGILPTVWNIKIKTY